MVKKLSLRFFRDGLITELLRGTCKGGLILAPYVSSNLKSQTIKKPDHTTIDLSKSYISHRHLENTSVLNMDVEMKKKPKINITMISDVICPWCYVGKKKLEKAMALASDRFEFELSCEPYLLKPDTPPEGKDKPELPPEKPRLVISLLAFYFVFYVYNTWALSFDTWPVCGFCHILDEPR